QERLLLQLMGLGGAGCRARTGGTLDGPEVESSGLREAFESRQDVSRCPHVSRFFLNPDNLARVGMLVDGRGDFRARQRIELVEKEDGCAVAFPAAVLRATHSQQLYRERLSASAHGNCRSHPRPRPKEPRI